MHLAVVTGNAPILELLLASGGNPNIQDRHGNSSAHLAVIYGSESCLQALLRGGTTKADLDLKNYDGNFSLYIIPLSWKEEGTI